MRFRRLILEFVRPGVHFSVSVRALLNQTKRAAMGNKPPFASTRWLYDMDEDEMIAWGAMTTHKIHSQVQREVGVVHALRGYTFYDGREDEYGHFIRPSIVMPDNDLARVDIDKEVRSRTYLRALQREGTIFTNRRDLEDWNVRAAHTIR